MILLKEQILPFDRFRVENDKARVGVITFGSDVNRGDNQMIELEDRDNPGVLQAAITLLDLVPTNGLNIPAAIDEMIAMFDRNPRPNVAKLALLIAGGFAGAPDVTLEDINKIKDAGWYTPHPHPPIPFFPEKKKRER